MQQTHVQSVNHEGAQYNQQIPQAVVSAAKHAAPRVGACCMQHQYDAAQERSRPCHPAAKSDSTHSEKQASVPVEQQTRQLVKTRVSLAKPAAVGS